MASPLSSSQMSTLKHCLAGVLFRARSQGALLLKDNQEEPDLTIPRCLLHFQDLRKSLGSLRTNLESSRRWGGGESHHELLSRARAIIRLNGTFTLSCILIQGLTSALAHHRRKKANRSFFFIFTCLCNGLVTRLCLSLCNPMESSSKSYISVL